jgi:hypothetical protein
MKSTEARSAPPPTSPAAAAVPAPASSPIDPVADLIGGGQTVAYKVDLALAVGNTTAGLLLSQFWYWTNSTTTEKRDGWFWLTADQITAQTGLSREEQMAARKRLRSLEVVQEEKRGTPMKLWFRLDKERLYEMLRGYAERKATNGVTADGKNKLWAKPKDELEALPNVGDAQSNLWALPNVKIGDSPEIGLGYPASLDGAFPNDKSKTSSGISLDISSGEPSPSHKCVPPEGDSGEPGEPERCGGGDSADSFATAVDDPLVFLWRSALPGLAERLNKPTFETHIRSLRPVSLDENDEGAQLTLEAPSAFSREWVDKRHGQTLCDVLSEQLGHAVTIRVVIARHRDDLSG